MASQQTPKQTPQQTPGGSHNRGFSFHVNYSAEEITNIAREIKEETVADVHLSLFTYWVCEKRAHFKEAKEHIREFGLDQGYDTSRITNDKLRKLVEDTRHLRPRYDKHKTEYGLQDPWRDGAPLMHAQNSQPRSAHRFSRHLSLRSVIALPRLSKFFKNRVNTQTNSDSSILDPKVKAFLRNRQASSPVKPASPVRTRPHSQITNSSGQALSYSPSVSRSNTSTPRQYPPDTPDRPAPLNLRPFGTDSAPGSAPPRSVSTPVRTQHQTLRSATMPSTLWENSAALALLSPTRESGSTASSRTNSRAGGLFGISNDAPNPVALPFTNATAYIDTLPNAGTAETEQHQTCLSHSSRGPGHSENNRTSGSPEDAYGSIFDDTNRVSAPTSNGTLDGTGQYDADSEEDSSAYGLTAPRHRPLNLIQEAVPTPSQRRTARQTRVNGFNRPLPLRNYETEPPENPFADLYRSLTDAHMVEALQRTRAQGGSVEWATLPLFERSWREGNEKVLVAIYGRRDVVLSDVEVSWVDRITREVAVGVERLHERIGQMFQDV